MTRCMFRAGRTSTILSSIQETLFRLVEFLLSNGRIVIATE